jgi:large subunit ribosomal protein L15
MEQNNLRSPEGARHKSKRVGRGDGSGHGSYSGRGCKGQKSRSGGGVRRGFEGGQMPIIKRLPEKRGFYNRSKIEYAVVNIGQLMKFDANAEVNPQALFEAGIIKSRLQPVKILGDGEIDRPLVVKACKYSTTAESKIVAAGGRIEGV